MEKKLKVITLILTMSIIGIWVLSKMPFESDINQTITAKIYKEGAVVQDTTVIMNGARSNYLFSNEQYYNGQFIVGYY